MNMSKQMVILLAIAVLLVAACTGAGGNAANGEKLFQQATLGKDNVAGCASCHSVEPEKVIVGPTLAGIATDAAGSITESEYVGKAKTAGEWLREAILQPDLDVPEEFPDNVMPKNYKDELTDQQVNDLVAYLLTLK